MLSDSISMSVARGDRQDGGDMNQEMVRCDRCGRTARYDERAEDPEAITHDETGHGLVCVADCPSDAEIQGLRGAAGQAGDLEQVAICDRALGGDEAARTECAQVIADARAMEDE